MGAVTEVSTERGLWIRPFHASRPGRRRTLVCFLHAGGSTTYYFRFAELLEADVDVLAVQYPGRQDRRRERCVESLAEMAELIADAFGADAATGQEFAFFGHSMGAVLAYEVARLLAERGLPGPTRVFVSGRRGPSRERVETVHLDGEAGLLAELRRLGGTDERLLADPETRALFVPSTLADYKAVETYRHVPGRGLACPVTVLVGDRDPHTTVDEARAWAGHTTSGTTLRVFPGGHFYLDQNWEDVAAVVRAALDTDAEGDPDMDGAETEVLLSGGPVDGLTEDERVRVVGDPGDVLKIAQGSYYDHYRATRRRIHVRGRELPVFAWSHRTFVAE